MGGKWHQVLIDYLPNIGHFKVSSWLTRGMSDKNKLRYMILNIITVNYFL